MHFMKHILLFTKKYYDQIWRKWFSLPSLLLLPILAVGLIVFIFISFFTQEDHIPIQIGIVDNDQSEETQLIGSLIEESSQLSSFMQMNTMSETQAIERIDKDELSAYLVFPKQFTESLYTGKSVNISIIGNPTKPTESYVIATLIDSVITQIRDSQANILTLNHYAKEIGMDHDERNDFVFEQFTEFVFFTLGRETIIHDREVMNHATSSPLHYYGLGSWFIIISLWSLIFYLFLTKEQEVLVSKRMKLYGVTELQQIIAKIFVVFTFVSFLSSLGFLAIYQMLGLELATENIIRIGITTLLYNLALIISLAIIEVFISQEKLRMLFQTLLTIILLLISGSLIPTIYFPLWLQNNLTLLFPAEAFHWLTEIILNQRFYADYIPLTMMTLALIFILFAISSAKERVHE